MSEADQIKVLIVLIGALWTLVMRMVWRGYDSLGKKVDGIVTQHILVEKDVVGLKGEVASLREWRHSQAQEEHLAVLRELQYRRNQGGNRGEPNPK